jgi:hypothetical protein
MRSKLNIYTNEAETHNRYIHAKEERTKQRNRQKTAVHDQANTGGAHGDRETSRGTSGGSMQAQNDVLRAARGVLPFESVMDGAPAQRYILRSGK